MKIHYKTATFLITLSLLPTLVITPPYIKAAALAMRQVNEEGEKEGESKQVKSKQVRIAALSGAEARKAAGKISAAPYVFKPNPAATDAAREAPATMPPAWPAIPTDIRFEPPSFYTSFSSSFSSFLYSASEVAAFNGAKDKNGLLLQGKLAGKGESIIRIARKHRLNPALLGAICAWETGRGKSAYAMTHNNVSGSLRKGPTKWVPRYFPTVEACLEFTANNLATNYIGQGYDTVEKIQQKYCPVITDKDSPDFNDPKGVNGHWLSGVKNFRALFMEGLDRAKKQSIVKQGENVIAQN